MSPVDIAKPSVADIDRAELVRLGPDVFRELERGTIFYLHGVDEVYFLRAHILAVLRNRVSADWLQEVQEFLDSGREMSRGALRELLMCLRELRDTRYLSCLFSDLIGGFGLPVPTLIDTGYFRCVFSRHAQALQLDPRLPRDVCHGPPPEPEGMLQSFTGTGNPHRDLDGPHYTFQVNFWFPLHRIEEGNSLLLFPDIYTKNVPYQERPANPQDPGSWGYGKPVCRAMGAGDVVLFHSQHFHASPTQAPDSPRVTAELRVVSACLDDNGSVYRRQFWNRQNFLALGSASGAARAARLSPPASNFLDPRTPQELVASVMLEPQAARTTGNLWVRDTVMSGTRKLEPDEAQSFAERLLAAPFAEDRQLFVSRYLLFHGYPKLAERVLEDITGRTESYFFALETARIAGTAQLWTVAGTALRRAIQLAKASTVQLGRYRGDIPTRPLPPFQLLPAEAARTASALAAALRDYLAAPESRPAPLLDHRIFYPFFVVARPLRPLGAVVGTWSLAILVPLERMDEAGLAFVAVDGEERVDVKFNPEALVRNPVGVLIGHNADELNQLLREKQAAGAL